MEKMKIRSQVLQNENELLARIRQALSSFSSSDKGRTGRRLFGLLIACMLLINILNVINSYVGRDFISSVESKDKARFLLSAVMYLMVFSLSTGVAAFYRFMEERLGLLWRDWQTRSLLQRYLANHNYLKLSTEGREENPDQRIAEDVRIFATSSLSIFLMFLNAALTAFAFSGVLWSINPLLFAGAVVYGFTGTAITVLLGRRLVGLNTQQTDYEASFRTELIRVRENAEVIVVLQNEAKLRDRLLQMFNQVIANGRHIAAINRNVSFFTTGYNYLVPIIPMFVVAHMFMRGKVEFGVVTQSSVAFAHLMGAFSLIVTQFQSMSSYAAVLNRIRALDEALDHCESPEGALILTEADGSLAYTDVTLESPDGQPLVLLLNVSIGRGERMLVRAANYRATRALFRATAGVSRRGTGFIERPPQEKILFLPEAPVSAQRHQSTRTTAL
jgi:putative ATP-binding cassette transporter